MLTVSSFLWLFYIRTNGAAREKLLETIADYIFIAALAGILVTILLITFSILK